MISHDPSPKAAMWGMARASTWGTPKSSWGQTLEPIVVQPSASRTASIADDFSEVEQAIDQVKVLHLVNGEHFSGAERVQSHLGRCLPECGVQADFVCLKPVNSLKSCCSSTANGDAVTKHPWHTGWIGVVFGTSAN